MPHSIRQQENIDITSANNFGPRLLPQPRLECPMLPAAQEERSDSHQSPDGCAVLRKLYLNSQNVPDIADPVRATKLKKILEASQQRPAAIALNQLLLPKQWWPLVLKHPMKLGGLFHFVVLPTRKRSTYADDSTRSLNVHRSTHTPGSRILSC
jgi:hypothetical protein